MTLTCPNDKYEFPPSNTVWKLPEGQRMLRTLFVKNNAMALFIFSNMTGLLHPLFLRTL